MNEAEVVEALHGAICEDSLSECREWGGNCQRAADVVRDLAGGWSS